MTTMQGGISKMKNCFLDCAGLSKKEEKEREGHEHCRQCDCILSDYDPHTTLCMSCSGDFSCSCEQCKENKILTDLEDGIYYEVVLP